MMRRMWLPVTATGPAEAAVAAHWQTRRMRMKIDTPHRSLLPRCHCRHSCLCAALP